MCVTLSFCSLFYFILLFFTFWLHPVACGILVFQPGVEPEPRAWKDRVLTTGPSGKSIEFLFFKGMGIASSSLCLSTDWKVGVADEDKDKNDQIP